VLRAADPPAKLVELRHAESVRAVDQDGIGVRDVEAALDDRRAEQDVELAADERVHDLGELGGAHLPVADLDARLGHELAEALADPLDGLHPVVEVEDLPLAAQLAKDGLRSTSSVLGATIVSMATRSCGGVWIVLRSRDPVRLMYSVRGSASR